MRKKPTRADILRKRLADEPTLEDETGLPIPIPVSNLHLNDPIDNRIALHRPLPLLDESGHLVDEEGRPEVHLRKMPGEKIRDHELFIVWIAMGRPDAQELAMFRGRRKTSIERLMNEMRWHHRYAEYETAAMQGLIHLRAAAKEHAKQRVYNSTLDITDCMINIALGGFEDSKAAAVQAKVGKDLLAMVGVGPDFRQDNIRARPKEMKVTHEHVIQAQQRKEQEQMALLLEDPEARKALDFMSRKLIDVDKVVDNSKEKDLTSEA